MSTSIRPRLQTIHVRAINDGVNEGPHKSLITHAIVNSTSAAYPVGMLINSVTARVMDDELPPVVGVDFDFATVSVANQLDASGILARKSDQSDSETMGSPRPIDLTIVNVGGGGHGMSSSSAITASNSIPIHNPSLAAIDGFGFATFDIQRHLERSDGGYQLRNLRTCGRK